MMYTTRVVLNDGATHYFSCLEVEEVRVVTRNGLDTTVYGYDENGDTVFVARNPKLVEVER